MSIGELAAALWPYLATALGSGGIVAGVLKYWLEARQIQTVDRQKLTDELHALYREATAAAEAARKEQHESDRQLAEKDREIADMIRRIARLESEQESDREFQAEQYSRITIKDAEIERLNRAMRRLEAELARPPYDRSEQEIEAIKEPKPKLKPEEL